MKHFFAYALAFLLFFFSQVAIGQDADDDSAIERIPIWDGVVAGFDADYEHKPMVQLDPERVGEITNGTISVFPAAKPNKNRASVMIFPGGGYRLLADLKEGDRVAKFLAGEGFTCFVVRYRVSKSNEKPFQFPGPLYDARQAMRYVRANAEKYDIDPEKIGVMGFSAGGHLASMAMTRYEDELDGEVVDEAMSEIGLRPAFGVLIYPVTTMVGPAAHGGSKRALFGESPSEEELIAASPERRLTAESPPMFLVHTEFDPVNSLGTLELAIAAKKAEVGCELHLYPTGGHGYGMGRKGDTEETNPVIAWPELLVKFLKRQ